jgi:biopolymer transport protein ExbD
MGLKAPTFVQRGAAGAAADRVRFNGGEGGLVEYSAKKRISINRQEVLLEELEARLRNVYEQRTDKTLFITAAGSLRYGDVVDVIDAAKGAGVNRVGIITEGMRRAAGVIP